MRGELDSAAAQGLADQLVGFGEAAIVIDLGDLTFISAAGIGALLQAKRHKELEGEPLVIVGARGIVRRVFGILNLEGALAD